MIRINSLCVFIVIILSAMSPAKGISQDISSEINAVTKTINQYFEGYIERDSLKLSKAFDIENGTMKVPIEINGNTNGFENKYFKDLLSIWSNRPKLSKKELEDCQLQIVTIDIEPNKIGTAKIKMRVGEITYVDILSLQIINGDWKITNKIYYIQ